MNHNITVESAVSGSHIRILGALGTMRLDAGGLRASEIDLLLRAAVRRLMPAAIDRAQEDLLP